MSQAQQETYVLDVRPLILHYCSQLATTENRNVQDLMNINLKIRSLLDEIIQKFQIDKAFLQQQIIDLKNELKQQKSQNEQQIYLRDTENSQLKEHFQAQFKRQTKEYEEMVQGFHLENNKWREKADYQDKMIIIQQDDINKKDLQIWELLTSVDRMQSKIDELHKEITQNHKKLSELEEQLHNADYDLYNKQTTIQKIKDHITQIQVVQKMSRQVEDDAEKFKVERDNLHIDYKLQIEQLQSQLAFERIKSTEKFKGLQEKLEQQQIKLQEEREKYEFNYSKLYGKHLELMKEKDQESLKQKKFRDDLLNQCAKDKVEIWNQCEEKIQKTRRYYIQLKVIYFIQSEVIINKERQKYKAQIEEMLKENQKLTQVIQDQGFVNADSVISIVQKMSLHQVEIVRNYLKKDYIENSTQNRGNQEIKTNSQIKNLKIMSQKVLMELDQYKQKIEEKQNLIQNLSVINKKLEQENEELKLELKQIDEKKDLIMQEEILKVNQNNKIIEQDLTIQIQQLNIEINQLENQLKDQKQLVIEANAQLIVQKERILKTYFESKQENISTVNEIFQQYNEYIEQLLLKIKILKSQSEGFIWRGNNKIQKDMDKFLTYFYTRNDLKNDNNLSINCSIEANNFVNQNAVKQNVWKMKDAHTLITNYLEGKQFSPNLMTELNNTVRMNEETFYTVRRRSAQINRIKNKNLKPDTSFEIRDKIFIPTKEKLSATFQVKRKQGKGINLTIQ